MERKGRIAVALALGVLLSAAAAFGQGGVTPVTDRLPNCPEATRTKDVGPPVDLGERPPDAEFENCSEVVNVVAGSLRPAATYSSLFSTSATQVGTGAPPPAGEDAAALAKKLSNPVASLISVPFQNNFDFDMGPNEGGWRYTLNFQPVIPITLNADWNLISRTILPIIHQSDVVGTGGQSGIGDIVQSFFLSPAKTEPFIWGFGPVLLMPIATNDFLGTEKFGIGPTFVILKQQSGWTYGALINHIWSVAGKDSRADVNSTFLQPFLSYTTRTAWTFTVNTESTYDWTGEQWAVPIHFQVTKLVRFGKQPVSLGVALRCWVTGPPGGPEGCGPRVIITPLFPK
jgi:hypothetical protein